MEHIPPLQVIAHIESPFSTKFGIPRQSGLVEELQSKIIFTPEYRVPEAVRGLGDFSHLWLIWQFSGALREGWSPTVRPPRLGGNTRMGVFATRSPFRPNELGLSCVKILDVAEHTDLGPVITVAGADLMDGTPIFDIKPYIPYADCHPEATGGFTQQADSFLLDVKFPPELLERVPLQHRKALTATLTHDPRPSYQNAPDRIYGMAFAGMDIRFQVRDTVLTVVDVVPL